MKKIGNFIKSQKKVVISSVFTLLVLSVTSFALLINNNVKKTEPEKKEVLKETSFQQEEFKEEEKEKEEEKLPENNKEEEQIPPSEEPVQAEPEPKETTNNNSIPPDPVPETPKNKEPDKKKIPEDKAVQKTPDNTKKEPKKEEPAKKAAEQPKPPAPPAPAPPKQIQVSAEPESDQDWAHILVNKKHPLPDGFSVQTVKIDGASVDKRIAPYVNELLAEAKRRGLSLGICSGYRTVDTQRELYNRKVKYFRNQGFNESTAKEKAAQIVAVPGTSEHNSGLAIDFWSLKDMSLEERFENTPEGKFLRENSYKYGFILRYPKNKTDITGVVYEPWHFRYVGKVLAEKIFNSNLTLEEFLGN